MKPSTLIQTLALAYAAAAADLVLPPTATIESGPLIGVQTTLPGAASPVNKFLGIPYGVVPERFCLPIKPGRWTSPREASQFGPSCTQFIPHSDLAPDYDVLDELFNFRHPEESEDCLSINVFAPATPGPPGGRPIVLFIPEGGFINGNGLSDLSGFAAGEDIIAMAFNYRTNIFGFPNSPDIPLWQRNLGLHDQRLAIQWVQTNARSFGGDSSKVTLWGESAGSMSVDIHLHAYAAAASKPPKARQQQQQQHEQQQPPPPPFRAAIMFSGQFSFGLLGRAANATDHSQWHRVAQAVGCCHRDTQLPCMRRVPAAALTRALDDTGALLFAPFADGGDDDDAVVRVPVLTGTIRDEGRALLNSNISLSLFQQVYLPERLVSRERLDAILSSYQKLPNLATDFDLAAAIYTDYVWQCARLANLSASLDNPTWRYFFNASITTILPPKFGYLRKFHGSDVILLFASPTLEHGAVPGLTPSLYAFANYLRGVVARFVKSPRAGPGWPATGSDGAGAFDVAVLGDVGDAQTAGATPVDSRELDERCSLYEDIYKILEALD